MRVHSAGQHEHSLCVYGLTSSHGAAKLGGRDFRHLNDTRVRGVRIELHRVGRAQLGRSGGSACGSGGFPLGVRDCKNWKKKVGAEIDAEIDAEIGAEIDAEIEPKLTPNLTPNRRRNRRRIYAEKDNSLTPKSAPKLTPKFAPNSKSYELYCKCKGFVM